MSLEARVPRAERVKRLPSNGNGRDFVVGDIHGHFKVFELLLADVGFDSSVDRILSTGDLIDRGPDSEDALFYLNEPWFHAVLGNHERILLDALCDPELAYNWQQFNGGSWWSGTPPEVRDELVAQLQRLPLALEVETRWGSVGIVHADVPPGMDWQRLVAALHEEDPEVCDRVLWSRERIYQHVAGADPGMVTGIGEVFVGHTPVLHLLSQNNVTFLDTGAGHSIPGASLTLLELGPQRHQWNRSTLFEHLAVAGAR